MRIRAVVSIFGAQNNRIDMDYTPKSLVFGADGRERLLSGLDKMAKAVGSTLGPRGRTVLIESQHHTHGITVTKDGVTVAKSIDLLDPVENLAIRMMRSAAERTATSAGDGTTTAVVLTEALVRNGMALIDTDHNATEVLRHMTAMTEEVVGYLTKRARKVTSRRLLDVATISANNDRVIGGLIAQAYNSVGENGLVTVEKGMGDDTTYEVTDGIRVDRGYASKLFVNDQRKDECVLEDAYILLTDHEISNVLQIEAVLKPIVAGGHKLLIIGPCTTQVVNTLAANVVKNGLKLCSIAPPQFGYKQHELMGDIAVSVGGRFISEGVGDDLSLVTMADLGKASKVIVSRDSTVIVRHEGQSSEVKERVEQLWAAHEMADKKADRDFIKQRIASLTGGIGIIRVGGRSDVEQKETYDRVEDAVHAVRSAIEEGILPGGGLALWGAAEWMQDKPARSEEERIAQRILFSSMMEPMCRIVENAGHNPLELFDINPDTNVGLNVKTMEYGDMYKMGVIDPLKVTKNALRNAVSVATTILSTNAIVTLARSYES